MCPTFIRRCFPAPLAYCLVLLSLCSPVNGIEISKGHRLLMQENLNIHAWVFCEENGGFNREYWKQSNFTGITLGGFERYNPAYYGHPGEVQWAIHGPGHITPMAIQYLDGLRTWCYRDEQNITDPAVLQDTVAWFERMRADPRFKDVILHTVQYGYQFTENAVRNYMAAAKPDILMFDYYIWGTQWPWLHYNGSPTALYGSLAKYRRLAQEGNDGTGSRPIPFGRWLQTYTSKIDLGPGSQALGYRMSESELRLDQFAGWAFGAKLATAFTYDAGDVLDSRVDALLFKGRGLNATPTPEFYYVAEANRQSRNLGPTLVRLHSTHVQMVAGPNSYRENGVPDFDGTADPFLKSVSATNLGQCNDGVRGDVLLGWFEPIEDHLQGSAECDQIYFMVVNGLSWKDASASDTEQLIRLDFDFGDSGISTLQRLSRETGQVEVVPLLPDGGSFYHLDLLLPGGTGDLFKFGTGGTFITIPDPPGKNFASERARINLAIVPEPHSAAAVLLVFSWLIRRQRAGRDGRTRTPRVR